MSSDSLRLYWSASKPNVGDWLSPLIVGAQSKREVVHAHTKQCDMIAIGSILQKLKNHWWSSKIDVWGSGLMFDCKPMKVKHRVHAVRGKLTRERLIGCEHVACGDPGLLVSKVLDQCRSDSRPYSVGVVPHYWDREDPQVEEFIARYPGAKFLDIFSDVEEFVRDLNRCECVLSSSLHGLVMADSFGIPNQWLVLSDKVEGNNFKFYDYYSVFDMPSPSFSDLSGLGQSEIETIIANYARPGLERVMDEVEQSFPEAWR